MLSEIIDPGTVRAWLAASETALKALDDERTRLDLTRNELAHRVALLRDLLDGPRPTVPPAVSPLANADSDSTAFRAALLQVLKETGGPLHLSEIRRLLESRGVAVPGRGSDANVITHLVRLNGVARVARGTYEFGGNAGPKKGVLKKKHRRRKRKLTTQL